MTTSSYRAMRQRIQIKRQSGSYVVTWPAGDKHPGFNREKIFTPAIGANAYQKARSFAKAKALELLDVEGQTNGKT
mgnify:CR=1 FL=1